MYVKAGEGVPAYQASSPDEVALVEWAGWTGLRLTGRTLTTITLTAPEGTTLAYDILQVTTRLVFRFY
jgi:phospholipid-translocating ATPase